MTKYYDWAIQMPKKTKSNNLTLFVMSRAVYLYRGDKRIMCEEDREEETIRNVLEALGFEPKSLIDEEIELLIEDIREFDDSIDEDFLTDSLEEVRVSLKKILVARKKQDELERAQRKRKPKGKLPTDTSKLEFKGVGKME